MKITLLTNIISPHQLPLAKALIALVGAENYRYIYTEPLHKERAKMGWGGDGGNWCVHGKMDDCAVLEADVLLSGHRALETFEKRNATGKMTFYMSERWFKPPIGFLRLFAPSYFRMVRRFVTCLKSPKFMLLPMGIHAARDFLRLLGLFKGDLRCFFRAPKVAFESKPGGMIVALKDAINAGLLSKDEIAFGKRYGFVQIPKEHWGKLNPSGMYAKMRIWGYFVAPSAKGGEDMKAEGLRVKSEGPAIISNDSNKNGCGQSSSDSSISNCEFLIPNCAKRTWGEGGHSLPIKQPPRVLWVGRMLDWKRVDDLVRACRPHPDLKRVDFLEESGERRAESGVSKNVKLSSCDSSTLHSVHLSLYGHGPEEERLRKLAKNCPNITFHDFVPVEQVRDLMRVHDIYVLPSNGYEGWGAVVSEALTERMKVLGTVEAGSSATILPPTHLFKAGDVTRLKSLLQNDISLVEIGPWTAEYAATQLLEFLL